MNMFRSGLVRLSVVGAVLLAPSFAHPAHAVTSTATIPFSGSYFDAVTLQTVNLTGALHVVTQVTFSSTATLLNIYADLPTGFGNATQVSGCKRVLFGATKVQQLFPPDPIRVATAALDFLYPTDPILPTDPIFPTDPVKLLCPLSRGGPVYLKLNLRFNLDGTLQNLACVDCPPAIKVCGLDPSCQ
jgi:hypothetical protein